MENKPSTFAILPAEVRYDKRLKPMERLLYAEITCLTHTEGYCYATNKYFADLYEVSTDTVSGWISHLVQLNYLRLEIKNRSKRKIYLAITFSDTSAKNPRGLGEKSEGG